ncbi:early nodulin-like protein 1 [Diospyros lotus]|uniref:early nodulin-like protein 1 n=1 Tax=Diospyros lotus TaxID=55363 RepID=UPI0022582780|nr:early nodulin-like protein 1 [Diospyros lotus]
MVMSALRSSSSAAAAAARRSSHKACHWHILLGLLLLVLPQGEAYQFKVGGAKGWAVPSDNGTIYQQWAENNRFQIGDSLLFVYRADEDSVLHVSKEDYSSCRTEAPIAKFSDGHTVFTVDHSGPFYFISGMGDHCHKNQKLVVVVLADRSNRSAAGSNRTTAASPSPAPSGSSVMAPAPVPESEYPSPPTGPVEIIPSPAPTEQTPPNAASPIGISFVGSIVGALLLGSWVLVF